MATEIEQYIRSAAVQRGIDPDIAVRVAKSEGGLTDPNRQSLVRKNGVQEPSYGPFQLLVGGSNGFPTGMGNDFIAKYGIHPTEDWRKGVDFALDGAAQNGWGAWYGAKAAGIGNRAGIGGVPGTSLATTGPITRPVAQGNGTGPTLANAAALPATPAAEPSLADRIGTAIWGDKAADLKASFGEGAKPNPLNKGLGMLGSAMGGGGSSGQSQETQIAPSAVSQTDGADAQRVAAAQQIMSTLMSRKRPGLQMSGRMI